MPNRRCRSVLSDGEISEYSIEIRIFVRCERQDATATGRAGAMLASPLSIRSMGSQPVAVPAGRFYLS